MEFSKSEIAANAILCSEVGSLLEVYRILGEAILDALCASDPELTSERFARSVTIMLLRSFLRDFRSLGVVLSLGYIGAAASVAQVCGRRLC